MIQKLFRCVWLLLVFSSLLHGQTLDNLVQSVNTLPGWVPDTRASTFNESDVARFDSHLAPSLLAYGVRGIAVQNWRGPSGRVRATLFQFMDAGAGYGFFSIRRKAERTFPSDSSAGTESFQTAGSRYFWQAQYVVRMDGDPRAMDALATILSERILGRSKRPPIVNHLPSSNLVKGSEEYILDAVNLQKIDGVDPASLGFDLSAEAAAAEYRVNGKTAHLLLMLYPTQQIAKKYADRINAVSPDLSAARKRIGPLLAFVSGTSDTSTIQLLLDQVHYESKVTWSEPQPGLGLGPVIVTVFTFIGILLGVCIVVGISLGGIRILMKTLYPNRVFDRRDDIEIIQLKLDQALIRKELGE